MAVRVPADSAPRHGEAKLDKAVGKDIDQSLVYPIGLVIFLTNCVIGLVAFDADIQGRGDAERGWEQFNRYIFDGEAVLGPSNQVPLRLGMLCVTVALLTLLRRFRLIHANVAHLYLVLPAAAYLAMKIKIEFLFFPLALVRNDLRLRHEIAFLGFLGVLGWFLAENNGTIIIVYRILVILLRRFTLRPVWLGFTVATLIFLDRYAAVLFSWIPVLARYNYTRTIANPEYNPVETVAVFVSSSVMSVNPRDDFWIGLALTLIVGWSVYFDRLSFSRFRQEISVSPNFQAAVITIFTFTTVTHAFQNSRYYFFYVPALLYGSEKRSLSIIAFLSVPSTLAMAVFYNF